MNIQRAAKRLQEVHHGELVYGDTDCVLDSTPVLIKNGDSITYMTVEDLSDGNWSRINPNKEISKAKPGYKIWSDKGFTDIVNVVRCGVVKPLSRVVTHVGEVTCSNEHSLLRENLESVKPSELKLRDKLCISELPLPEDTPLEPTYPNNLTEEKIREYKIRDVSYKNLSAELAFVWGVFFADGSCGIYKQKEIYDKCSWAINKKSNLLLERCLDILKRHETSIDFKILDTMRSSSVNKLVAKQKSRKKENMGDVKKFVTRYRSLFYDSKKCKKIPDIIFNSPYHIREGFFMGYYAGDGSKKDSALSITNKGAIGSAGLFFLLRSLGYKVSVNTRKDKFDCYKLTGSSPKQKFRYHPKEVKKILQVTQKENTYIYDIQTGNHHFAAGVGQIVVHNSNYIHFPQFDNAQELWDHCLEVEEDISSIFPPPMRMAFEEVIYWRFLILTKKRYMYLDCGRDGVVSDKVGKKGVLLARRDNSAFIRQVYKEAVEMTFARSTWDQVMKHLCDRFNNLCSGFFSHRDFVITKSIGEIADYATMSSGRLALDNAKKRIKQIDDYYIKCHECSYENLPNHEDINKCSTILDRYASHNPLSFSAGEKEIFRKKLGDCCYFCAVEEWRARKRGLPAHVQLAEKMRRRGQRVDAGERLEYIVTNMDNLKAKLWRKLEHPDYYKTRTTAIKVDYLYYLKLLSVQMDQLISVTYKQEKFTETQLKARLQKVKVCEQIKNIFTPNLEFL
jgi:hypothetical protein